MKRKLPVFLLLLCGNLLSAQEYAPLHVDSGYNADVVADGYGPALNSTSIAVDNANFNFMANDFHANDEATVPDYALPVSGFIESTTIDGLTYQMAPFSENNSLRLHDQNDAGTLVFTNAVTATTIYIMACSGSGQANLGGVIYFSDNSSQEISGVIPDWFNSTLLPVIVSGFGRVNRNTDALENPANNPRLYQLSIEILPENQAKTIVSIDFTKTSSVEGVINIMGVSAKLLGSCPSPGGLESSTTESGATVNWTAAVITPAGGYDYYYSVYPEEPSASQTPSGTLAAAVNSVTLSGLAIGQEYYFWIRSNCSASEKGPWIATTFTTGQIGFPYGQGDIATLYSSDAITTESENSCPGLFTVSVPAGYKIASTSVAYDMQTASNGWKSEQRSLLICNTTGNAEPEISAGVGGSSGTYSYSRTGLDIANGAYGEVEFELRAWRTYGSSDCNMDYNRVLGDTFNITITYEPIGLNVAIPDAVSFAVYPNPAQNVLHISGNEIISQIRLYNLLGQEVSVKTAGSKVLDLDTADLSSGTYMLKIITDKGVATKSILKD